MAAHQGVNKFQDSIEYRISLLKSTNFILWIARNGEKSNPTIDTEQSTASHLTSRLMSTTISGTLLDMRSCQT
jgi:hypothetical protein